MNSSWLQSGFVHSSRPCFSPKAFLIERDSWFQCRKAAQSLPDRKPLRPTCFKAQQHTWENDLVNDILLSSSDLLHNFVLSSFFPLLPSYILSALLWVFQGCFKGFCIAVSSTKKYFPVGDNKVRTQLKWTEIKDDQGLKCCFCKWAQLDKVVAGAHD